MLTLCRWLCFARGPAAAHCIPGEGEFDFFFVSIDIVEYRLAFQKFSLGTGSSLFLLASQHGIGHMLARAKILDLSACS